MNLSKKLLAFVAVTSLIGSQLYSAEAEKNVAIGEGNIQVEPVKVTSNETRIELRTELTVLIQKLAPFILMFDNAADKTKKLTKKAVYKNIVKSLEKMVKNAKKASEELEQYKVNAAVDVNQSLTPGGLCVEVRPSETPNGQIETEAKKEVSKTTGETAVIPVQPEGNKVVLTTTEEEQKQVEELKKAQEELKKAEEDKGTVKEMTKDESRTEKARKAVASKSPSRTKGSARKVR